MQFAQLRLAEPILRAVAAEGYTHATPIQAQAIPPVLQGRDVLGCAQTGTGKTAAFALPILHRLSAPGTAPAPGVAAGHTSEHAHAHAHHRPAPAPRRARCLVLCPTRELATQIAESFRTYGQHLGHRCAVIFGGVSQGPQVEALRRGAAIVVATPGRLLDLMRQGHVDLRGIEVLVLDEADRMLDMGFIADIRTIVAQVPPRRQTLLFSATMPPPIRRLAQTLLRDPVTVQVAPPSATADGIDQSVYFVPRIHKSALLAHLVSALPMRRALVFTRTKRGADRVVQHLHGRGIRAEAIHGNKTQNARERALENFRARHTPVLVATDIASRGIDVDGITHVVNYDISHEPEIYVHRIGRTARAGATGAAVSFCDREELPNLQAIEQLIRRSIPVQPTPAVVPSLPDRPTPPRPSGHRPHPQAVGAPHHAPAGHAPKTGRGTVAAGRPHGLHPRPAGAPTQGGRRRGGPGHPSRRRRAF